MISIAIAYYNRKQQFINTLNSIKRSAIKDVQIVVVDDASDENNRLEDLVDKYNITLFRFEPHEKNWINPCIAYNKAFSLCVHDKIIIQNPECYHLDDICQHAYSNLEEGKYISYACYSIDYNMYQNFNKVSNFDEFLRANIVNRGIAHDFQSGWYNHSIYRPSGTGLHFTSAIHKKDLDALNGFDERYATGIAWDDNEFLHRIKLLTNNNVVFVDDKITVHQWHPKGSVATNLILMQKNQVLFNEITLKENKIRVND